MINFDDKAAEIHAQNKLAGWWDNMDRCMYETLQLVCTELAEATEGERKDLMDDHLPHRKMGEVELADALIRLLDLGGRYQWDYDGGMEIDYDDAFRNIDSVAGMHFVCTATIVYLGSEIRSEEADPRDVIEAYTCAIKMLIRVGFLRGYDILSAMEEKLEYNKHRADHKRENRAAEHGKKF